MLFIKEDEDRAIEVLKAAGIPFTINQTALNESIKNLIISHIKMINKDKDLERYLPNDIEMDRYAEELIDTEHLWDEVDNEVATVAGDIVVTAIRARMEIKEQSE